MSRLSLAAWRTAAMRAPYWTPRSCLSRSSAFDGGPSAFRSVRANPNSVNLGLLPPSRSVVARLYSDKPRKPPSDETENLWHTVLDTNPYPVREETKKDEPKPILQQTTELRKQLSDRISKNLNHENIYTLPNILTFSRLLATPAIGYLILHDANAWAVGLLFYAGVTDLIDGWVARRWKLQTVVGTVIDPLADKALMTILTVCLAVKGALPIWLATLILGRDVSLAIAAIYYRYASLPAPKTFARYWDFSLPSAEVHPTGVSKANTFLQLLLIGAATAMPIAEPAVNAFMTSIGQGAIGATGVMTASQYLVATTTAWSGASYLWTKNAVKILGQESEAKKKRILVKGRMVLGASFASCFALALVLEQLYA